MYNFFELSQLLSVRASKNFDSNNRNAINTESVFLRQTSNSSICCYALWSNAKRSSTAGKALHSYLALCVTNGMLLFYRLGNWKNDRPVLRQLPWYSHPSKQIAALCFDPTGSWLLVAAKDASLYILPARKFVDPQTELVPSWSTDDVTEIQLPGRRAKPTQICWWQTQDGQEIAIVGNELGEISFINLVLHKEVGGTYITVGISELELIVDDANGCTYVLLTGSNDVQWQLILEQKQANYQWPLEKQEDASSPEAKINKGSSSLSILSCLSIAEDRMTSIASDKDTRPKRLVQYAGHTHLQGQCWQNRTLISGKYSRATVLAVLSPDLNTVPKSFYKLPSDSCHIYLADRILFVVTTDSLGSCIHVISTQFASTAIDSSKDYNTNSELQSFSLDINENVLGLVGHSDEDGCILVTDQAIYALRSRISPEDFFLELVLKEGDFSKADQFAKIFGLDALVLYEKAADKKLADGQMASAVRLYQLAKCSHIRTIAKFATYGYVSELLSYVNVLFTTKTPDFSAKDLKHFSNIALYCFIQQCLELNLSNNSIRSHFRRFLHENQHYDEQLAMQLLAAYGMYDLLLELGDWRGLMPLVLKELLPRKDDSELECRLKPGWIDSKLATVVTENGYGALLTLTHNDYFLSCLLSDSLPFYLGTQPDLLQWHIYLMKKLVPLLDEHTNLRKMLLKIYNPSHPAYVPLLNNFRCSRQATNEFNYETSEFDFATDKPALDYCRVLQNLVDIFLHLIAYLNKSHYSAHGFHPLLVNVHSGSKDKEISTTSQDFRLSRQLNTIACGFAHAAVVIDGSLYTWGRSAFGCLGHGPVRRDWLPPEPILRPISVHVSSVACGVAHTLALTDAGLFSWGLNSHGQLGFGSEGGNTKRRCFPTCVEALAEQDIAAITCGQYHSIVLMADGTPLSFGWGVHGQLGHGNAQSVFHPKPIEAMRGKPVSKISAGYGHSLLLTATGDVYAFGCGTFGQMGTGRTAKENKPIQVELDEAIIFIAAGYFHNVVVSTSGKVFTWGCNPQTLRMRAQAHRRERASRITPSTSIHQERTHDECPESNVTMVSDQLSSARIFIPQEVNMESVIGQVVGVACGANHSVLVTSEGICYSWGRNYGGQLGLDTRKEQLAPTQIATISDDRIVEVKCGADFTLVVDDGGKLFGFGMDDFGQVCGASESSSSADSNLLPSPGKVFTVRTNKRVVQIKSCSRNSIYKPIVLNALPQITNRKSVEEYDAEALSQYIVFRRLFKNDPEYSDAVLHSALEAFEGLYDKASFESKFVDDKNFQAAAKIALMDGQYERSLSLNLQSLTEDKSLTTKTKVEMVLKLLEIYVRFINEDAERLKSLLELVIIFWSTCCLPTEDLEEYFIVHLHKFLTPLAMLVFVSSAIEKEDDGRLSHFMSHLSNRFCMILVEQVIEKVNSGNSLLGFLDVLTGMMHVDATGHPQLKLWIPGSTSGMPSAPSTSERSTLSDGTSNSSNIKCAIDLPTSEVQELLLASKGTDKTRILMFTCGHHYPVSTAQELVLPRFQELLSAAAPQISKTLVSTYETQGFQPMACPKCFIEGVQQEGLVPSPLAAQSAPDCFA